MDFIGYAEPGKNTSDRWLQNVSRFVPEMIRIRHEYLTRKGGFHGLIGVSIQSSMMVVHNWEHNTEKPNPFISHMLTVPDE